MTGKRVRSDGARSDASQEPEAAGGKDAGELAGDAPALVLHGGSGRRATVAESGGGTGPRRADMEAAQDAERDPAALTDRNALLASICEAIAWEPAYRADDPLLEHAHRLYWLTRVAKPTQVVALGVGEGSGYFALCAAATGNDTETSLIGIDDWRAEGAGEGGDRPASAAEPDAVPPTLHEHNARHYAKISRLMRAPPGEAAAAFDKGGVDLLVLCRETEARSFRAVIDDWLPSMSERGLVVVPDAQTPKLEELGQGWPHLDLGQGNGLLVLMVGQSPPAPVAFAAGLAPESPERALLAHALGASGRGLAHRVRAETARDAAARLDAELQSLRAEVAAQLARRDVALAERARELETAEMTRRDLEARVARQREELRFLTARAEELRKELARQADEVGAIRGSMTWRLTAPVRKLKVPLLALRARLRNRASASGADGIPGVAEQVRALRQSPLFDSKWYAARFPECGGADKAAEHYVTEGAFTGNDPGPDFDTVGYYDRNADVAASAWPALSHYLFHGRAEGRTFKSET
jgi:O-antigen biosynthesis protein